MHMYKSFDDTIDIYLDRALHAPSIKTLFSVNSLVKQGYEIVFRLDKPGLETPDGIFVPFILF